MQYNSMRIVTRQPYLFVGVLDILAVEVLLSAISPRSLRSFQQGLLLVPFAFTSTMQVRAFSVVSPRTWNGLPSGLRIFNRTLSAALFLNLRLLFLTVMVLGSLLNSFLEKAHLYIAYKCSV